MRFRDDGHVAVLTPRRGAPALFWGGFLGDIAGGIKNAVTSTGHVLGQVASNPIVEGIAGATLGPEAAAALGGIGHLIAPGGNLGSAVKGAATGGAAGLAGGALSGIASGGLSGVLNGLKGGSTLAGMASGGAAGGTTPAGGPSVLQNFLGGSYTGGINPALVGLTAAQGVNAANLGAKANDFADKTWSTAQDALKSVNDDWAARAGLRSQGINQLATAAAPNPNTASSLSRLSQISNRIDPAQNSGNGGVLRTRLG